jgi:hypothetical protein
VHNWQMGWLGEKKKKSCSICHGPSFVTTRSFDVGIYESLKPLFEFLAMPKKQQ